MTSMSSLRTLLGSLSLRPLSAMTSAMKASMVAARPLATIAQTTAPVPTSETSGRATTTERHRLLKNLRPAKATTTTGATRVGEPVAEIVVQGYYAARVKFYASFAQRAAYHMGVPARGPIPLRQDVRRWTVLTSPFKYKKFQETFERRTSKRLLTLHAASPDAVDKLVQYLTEVAPAGVGLRVVRYEREEPGVGARMDALASTVCKELGGAIALPAHVYSPSGKKAGLDAYYRGVANSAYKVALLSSSSSSPADSSELKVKKAEAKDVSVSSSA
ncbi:ribosomal protein S10 domain-containing protein [Blastocladiella britannica]|nr:ribosomal protein S10 domain-containing protein [Blastocladiella britannica]